MNRGMAVIALIGINTLLFLMLTQSPGPWGNALALWPIGTPHPAEIPVASHFRLWQLISYGFVHGSLMHLFLNMYALWLFGRALEADFGSQRFLTFYLSCIVGAGLFHLLVQLLLMQKGIAPAPVIGASGGTFGVLMAFAYLYPDSRLYLLIPPMPVRAKWFVVGYGVVELLFGVTGTANGIAHFAHLGGMFTGYLLVRYWIAPAR